MSQETHQEVQLSLQQAFDEAVRLNARRDTDAAISLCTKALEADPVQPGFLRERALAYFSAGRLAEAFADIRLADAYQPRDHRTLMMLSVLYATIGEYGKARELQDYVMTITDSFPALRWNRALGMLQEGNFREGFREYEWGLVVGARHLRTCGEKWDGNPFCGTLFLWAEQGYGDTLMLLRFIPEVVKRMKKGYEPLVSVSDTTDLVLLEVQEKLVSLVSQCVPKNVRVYAKQVDGTTPSGWDRHASLFDLPLLLGISGIGDISGKPYIDLGGPLFSVKPRVALALRGNPEHANDRHRSIPYEAAQKLKSVIGVDWVHINPGFPPPWDMECVEPRDFLETANILRAVDIIVTADTALGHLGGAMGIPTILLLGIPSDWRWQASALCATEMKSKSIWYEHHRIISMTEYGNWYDVIDRCAKLLQAKISQGGDIQE